MPSLATTSNITSPRAGDRNHRQNRNPRDLTGRTYQRQHAEQDAKRAAANVNVESVRQVAFKSGYTTGFEEGAAWAFEQLRSAGVDVDAALETADPSEDK